MGVNNSFYKILIHNITGIFIITKVFSHLNLLRVFSLPEGVRHLAGSALLGLLAEEDGAVEGLSNSLSSILALLT